MATTSGHFSSPFLLATLFSPLFPHDPTLQPLVTDVLFPRKVHGLQPLQGSQRLVSVIFQSLGYVHLVWAPSYSARKAPLLWIQCPSGGTPFIPSVPSPVLTAHTVFTLCILDQCFSLYTGCLFQHTHEGPGRWGEQNIKKVPAPKNSEKYKRAHIVAHYSFYN